MEDARSRYTLESTTLETGQRILAGNNSYQVKHQCPGCGQRRFVRFVDTETLEYLPEQYGRCDREESCGYYLHPANDGYKPTESPQPTTLNRRPKEPPEPSLIPASKARGTIHLESNKLYQFLSGIFNQDSVAKAFRAYGVGTDQSKWPGAPIFYQIDAQSQIRGGKVIDYQPNGHRVKDRATWVHSMWRLENFNMVQCFFGLHLVSRYPGKPICIVESEKTALVASVVWPQYTWLATGGLSNKPIEKAKELTGQRVTLIPDVGAADKWKAVAKELNQLPGADFHVFEYLEIAGQPDGYDIADMLIETTQSEAPNQPTAAPTDQTETPEQTTVPLESEYENLNNGYSQPLTRRAWEYEFERMAAINPALRKLKRWTETRSAPFP
jgi:hypothetical protein